MTNRESWTQGLSLCILQAETPSDVRGAINKISFWTS